MSGWKRKKARAWKEGLRERALRVEREERERRRIRRADPLGALLPPPSWPSPAARLRHNENGLPELVARATH